MTGSLLRPALLGGVLMGVLSALPFVSAGNCCCCLWVVGGGLLAAFLLQQGQPTAIDVGDGALVGLLAGIIGAVISSILSIPIAMMMGPMEGQILERIIQNVPNMPPEMETALENVRSGGVGAVSAVVGFLAMLVIGMIFSTVGGLLGAILFRRGKPRVMPAGDAPTPGI
jgi:hypothetical protein